MKLGSRGLWPSVLASGCALAFAAAATGCVIVDGGDDSGDGMMGGYTAPPALDANPMQVSVESDVSIDQVPGDGVGMFVEYGAGGHWRISTTCDTTSSKAACTFEAYVTVDSTSTLTSAQGEGLSGSDRVTTIDNGTGAYLYATTATEADAMTFDTTPGATVRLEMYLDGQPQPRFVYWYGDGVVHAGAPTDPVDFVPTKP